MKITIINNQKNVKFEKRLIQKVSAYITDKFDSESDTELNIIFVNRSEIRSLNKKYRNRDIETDVLSFTYNNKNEKSPFDIELEKLLVGEIIIAPEVAADNTKRFDKEKFNYWDTTREIVLLIIHGILHIYSYDHQKKDEKIRMESIQYSLLNDVLTKFGI
jgi:probable rRNA maturation factor